MSSKGLSFGERIFDIFNVSFFILLSFLMLYPFWNVFVVSISDYKEYAAKVFYLWPETFNLESYKFIFSTSEIFNSMKVTVTITLLGTLIAILMTTMAAYALSKKDLPGRNVFFTYIILTMFFGGGLVPYYINMKRLGLVDSLWVLILPGAMSTYNMIIIKNYFNTLPESLEESAAIEGANDIQILLRIIIPISKPVIATFTLFYGVAFWNEWWHATLFINNQALFTLQKILRDMVVRNTVMSEMASSYASASGAKFLHTENIKMATVIVATVPILMAYPFLQKYFAKGIMIGAVKS